MPNARPGTPQPARTEGPGPRGRPGTPRPERKARDPMEGPNGRPGTPRKARDPAARTEDPELQDCMEGPAAAAGLGS